MLAAPPMSFLPLVLNNKTLILLEAQLKILASAGFLAVGEVMSPSSGQQDVGRSCWKGLPGKFQKEQTQTGMAPLVLILTDHCLRESKTS